MNTSVPTRVLFWLWLPLALSFTLMMMESPATNAILSRFPDSATQLAGFGVALGLSLLIESPVIMLLATAIALVRGRESFLALSQFVLVLIGALTILTALIAYTPLYDAIALHLLGLPEPVAESGRMAMRVMLLWSALIGWRRFLQGVLIRYGGARFVTWGTAIRLLSIVVTGVALLWANRLPGAVVGALMVMTGVFVEAVVTTLFAYPILRQRVFLHFEDTPPPTLSAIWRFHLPLALTTLLTLLVHPLTAGALARMPAPEITLASWSVVFGSLLIVRSWSMALQEASVAGLQQGVSLEKLKRFTLWVALGTTGVLAVAVISPLLEWFTERLLALEPQLSPPVRYGIALCLPLPAITAVSSTLRGILIQRKQTAGVYWGMTVNLIGNAGLLFVGVWLAGGELQYGAYLGLTMGILAFQTAGLAEVLYLAGWVSRRVPAPI